MDRLSSAPQARRGHRRGSSAFMRVEVDLSPCMPAAWLSTASRHSCQWGSSPAWGQHPTPGSWALLVAEGASPGVQTRQHLPVFTSPLCSPPSWRVRANRAGVGGLPKEREYQQDVIKGAGFPIDMARFVFSHKTLSCGLTPETRAHRLLHSTLGSEFSTPLQGACYCLTSSC